MTSRCFTPSLICRRRKTSSKRQTPLKEKARKLSTSGQPKSTNVTNRQYRSVENTSKMGVSEHVGNEYNVAVLKEKFNQNKCCLFILTIMSQNFSKSDEFPTNGCLCGFTSSGRVLLSTSFSRRTASPASDVFLWFNIVNPIEFQWDLLFWQRM